VAGASVAILDYGLGNLFSLAQACRHVGAEPAITQSRSDLAGATAVILPGIGAFGNAMKALAQLDLIGPLRDLAAAGKPLMGVCLGMQLLFERSEEFGDHDGLGILPGEVRRFPDSVGRIPAIGWQRVTAAGGRSLTGTPLAALTPQRNHFYFLHSYYGCPGNPADALALSTYGNLEYCCAVLRGSVFGCQFHPEKSGPDGLRIIRDFVTSVSATGS
jgi:imidazole glycerol-phosphate synthase subunit HisH